MLAASAESDLNYETHFWIVGWSKKRVCICVMLRQRRSKLDWPARPSTFTAELSELAGRGEGRTEAAGIEIRRKNANKNARLSLFLSLTFYGLKFSWLKFFVHLAGVRDCAIAGARSWAQFRCNILVINAGDFENCSDIFVIIYLWQCKYMK